MSDDKVIPLFNRNALNAADPSDVYEPESATSNLKNDHTKHAINTFHQFMPLMEEGLPPGAGVFTPNAYKRREDYLNEAREFRNDIGEKVFDEIKDEFKEELKDALFNKIVESLNTSDALEVSVDPGGVYVKLDEPLIKHDEQGNTLYRIPEGILRIPKNHLGELDLNDLKNVHHYDVNNLPNSLKAMWDEDNQTFKDAQPMSATDYYINQALLTIGHAKESIMRRIGLSAADPVTDFMGDYSRILRHGQTDGTEGEDDPILKRLVDKYKRGDISDALPDFTQSASEINRQAARDMIDSFGVMDRASKDFESILKSDPVAGPMYENWSKHAFKPDRASQMKASYYASNLEAVLSSNDTLARKLTKPMENMATASEIISMIQAQPGSDLVMNHLAGMRESLFSQVDMKSLHASTERFSKFFQQVDANTFLSKVNVFSEEQLQSIKQIFDPENLKKIAEMVSNVINGISQKLQSAFGFGEEAIMP